VCACEGFGACVGRVRRVGVKGSGAEGGCEGLGECWKGSESAMAAEEKVFRPGGSSAWGSLGGRGSVQAEAFAARPKRSMGGAGPWCSWASGLVWVWVVWARPSASTECC
jgi:hypothetical protein